MSAGTEIGTAPGPSTAEQVLFLLKTRGPQTTRQLATALSLTSMGARRQLEAWLDKGLVRFDDTAEGTAVGRPARQWWLTEPGHARFPDRHADLSLQLITQVRALFGQPGLERLIAAREHDSERIYQAALSQAAGVPERVAALAGARSAEGYMAEVTSETDGGLLLIEHHCPICAAASQCQDFCRSELELFRHVLGPGCSVSRSEHLLSGGRRCVYRIKPV